jgi:PAS domain S-box-containing protein
MMKPPFPQNESERLETLHQYQILDTPPESTFDDLTRLASDICETPIALITFIDAHRQWFKSTIGLSVTETPREISFCAHAIMEHRPFIVRDASSDPRFADHPWVIFDPHIRFYAAAPLRTPQGHALGTVCVMDRTPRELRPKQLEDLETIAHETMSLLDLRRRFSELSRTVTALQGAEERDHFFHLSLDLLLIAGFDGSIRQINPAFERICGARREEIQARPLIAFIHPDDRNRTEAELDKIKAGHPTASFEVRILRSDGSHRWILWSATPRVEKGLIYAVGHDITELKQAQEEVQNLSMHLEARVQERTAQLTEANQILEKEIAQRKQAEEALRDSEEKYRLLFERNPQPTWVYDLETLAFLAVNEAAVRHYGYRREEFLSMTIREIRPKEDIPALLENISSLTGGIDRAGVWRHLKKDGTQIDVEVTSHPLLFSGRRAELVLVNDVTERKRAEEERAQLLSREQEAHAAAVRAQWRFTFLAEASEILSESLDYETTLAGVARLAVPYLADGCVIDLLGEGPSIRRVAVAAADRSKEALGWELIRRYPPEPEGSHPLRRVLVSGKSMFLSEIPDTLLEAIARDPEHLKIARSLGIKSAMIVPLSARGKTLGAISFMMMESGRRFGEDDLSLAEDLARRIAVAVDNARLYRAAQEEIRERKEAEEALRKSEAKNRALLDAIPDMMFQIHRDGIYLDFKPAKDLTPVVPPEMFLGKNLQEILPAEVARQAMECIRRALETNTPQGFEYSLPTDGESRDYEARIIASGEDQVLSIVREITERKRAEEALRESEEKYRIVVENIDEIVYRVEFGEDLLRGNVQFVSGRVEKIIGYRPEDFYQTPGLWFQIIHPEDVPMLLDISHALSKGQPVALRTYRLRHKTTGAYRWMEDKVVPQIDERGRMTGLFGVARDVTERKRAEEALESEKERLAVTLRSIGDGVITTDMDERVVLMNKVAEDLTGWTQQEAVGRRLNEIFRLIDEKSGRLLENPAAEVLETGATFGFSAILISRDGTERIISHSADPIRDKAGHAFGVVFVFRDVTQKRKMEEEFLRTGKLEAVGLLAGGIAHDFNNLLTAILGNLSLVKMSIDPEDSLYRRVADAETASLRARDLAQQLLTFAKGGAPIKKTVSMRKLLEESIRFALRGSNVAVEFFLSDDLCPVEIDEGQITQVLHNLVINAQQAMPEGGRIQVRAENILVSEMDKRLPLPPGRYVEVSIQDFGIGIPKEHLPKIFDPYFTTKQKGSGLGLSTSYSIIKKHDGYMRVDSELGKGSTFSIYLPASSDKIEPERPPEALLRGQGKILIMDDEEAVREVAGEILTLLGYQVGYAEEGGEAIARFQEASAAGAPFDLVLMDLTVPGKMGGKEAIQKLLEIDPHVKAIVSSGYSNDPIMADYARYGFKGVIAKPYQIEELSKTVHEVLMDKRG